MQKFSIGQRWISEMEPELGLGVVAAVEKRMVTIQFSASEIQRQYALASAPLKRVEFKVGDSIKLRDGRSIIVKKVSHRQGIIIYHDENIEIHEEEISDKISFTSPLERLLSRFVDKNSDFELRCQSLNFRHEINGAAVRGFIGGRIDLLSHQLYIANAVSSSLIPRFLLSDETGLGKTIEVSLILHRLLSIGRINRVLILVPESLVHQWFIELFKRFNLVFQIFDEEYCQSIVDSEPESNPFLESQAGIGSMDFIVENPKWSDLAISAGWDMVVIDEAHHLAVGSNAYEIVERLSRITKGLLLLTATPEQLGHKSHFARLHLIDPDRYFDFEQFEEEEKHYLKVAKYINTLEKKEKPGKTDLADLARLTSIPLSPHIEKHNKSQLIDELLDRFGTGRAVFRNTRSALSGFPKRFPKLIGLKGNEKDLQVSHSEYLAEIEGEHNKTKYRFDNDPRIFWLVDFLQKNTDKKILLICSSLHKVKAIEDALLKLANFKIALFHEEATLLQRDRSAAWFAESDGAQMLICSEIGSEGRNFQFANDLVLFDLPLNPELLEQRIGRLDRIGQKKDINIYIPYIIGSNFEILVRWYNEGLNAFNDNVPGVYQVFRNLADLLKQAILTRDKEKSALLIKETRSQCVEIKDKLKKGRDRLLEINSFQAAPARKIIKEIREFDSDKKFPEFVLEILNFYGIREEDISAKTFKLDISALSDHEFPLLVLNKDEIIITFDRQLAIKQEDLVFLSRDNPMITGALDLILGSEKGNCAVATWPNSGGQGLLLEAIFVLEAIAPARLNIDRFLAPAPIRVVVDHSLNDLRDICQIEILKDHLKNGINPVFLENQAIKQKLVPAMLDKCESLIEKDIKNIISESIGHAEKSLSSELARLNHLKKINNYIREEEILSLEEQKKSIKACLSDARPRLDALRLIVKEE